MDEPVIDLEMKEKTLIYLESTSCLNEYFLFTAT